MSDEHVERRLAAILAGDVVGYSRLMGVDEVGTLRDLKAIRRELADPAISRHHGRVVKTTGDGILIEFPSVVDAVACAVAIQDGMVARNSDIAEGKRIVFRIGINIGDIIIDEADIHGEGVNIAARLEGLAQPGGICVSGASHDQVIGKLDVIFEDMGEQHLKNIARPIRVYRVVTRTIQAATSASQTSISGRPARVPPALPDKPSIAVLPFQNMSGDPEQEYFADGIVEEIITALSRVRSFFVIARNSSFTYKGRAVDVKQVGRELGVRYVLEGSVRKAGDRVRITGQLVDAHTGHHIWADRFDGPLTEVFELQDQVTSRVVAAVEPNLQLAEIQHARSKPTEDLGNYDLYLRAVSVAYSKDKAGSDEAVSILSNIVRADPNFVLAKAQLAWLYAMRRERKLGNPSDAEIGARLAREVSSVAKDDPTALRLAGHAIAYLERDYETGYSYLSRSLALNPNSALGHSSAGWCRRYLEDYSGAIVHFETALRLSPLDPEAGYFYAGIAATYNDLKQYEKALPAARRAIEEMPGFVTAYQMLIRSLVGLGHIDEAKVWGAKLLELEPGMTLSYYRKVIPIRNQAIVEQSIEAHRLAGIPE